MQYNTPAHYARGPGTSPYYPPSPSWYSFQNSQSLSIPRWQLFQTNKNSQNRSQWIFHSTEVTQTYSRRYHDVSQKNHIWSVHAIRPPCFSNWRGGTCPFSKLRPNLHVAKTGILQQASDSDTTWTEGPRRSGPYRPLNWTGHWHHRVYAECHFYRLWIRKIDDPEPQVLSDWSWHCRTSSWTPGTSHIIHHSANVDNIWLTVPVQS